MSEQIINIGAVYIYDTPKPCFTICLGPILPQETTMPTEVRMSSEMKALVTITPTTPGGAPATLDGPARFTITGACSVQQTADNEAWVYGAGPGTDSSLEIMGDADLGEGVVTIIDTVLFHIDHPQATSLGTTVATPVLKEPGDPS